MNDTNNDITVIITDNEEPFRPRSSGDKPERPRLPRSSKFIALWNLLFELIIGIPFLGLMAVVGDDHGGGAVIFCGLLFAFAHMIISVTLFYRHYCENGVPAWKFVLLNVLPLLIIGAVLILIPILSETTALFDDLDLSLGFLLYSGFLGICFGGYSIVYGALLSAVLGIGHLTKRIKS